METKSQRNYLSKHLKSDKQLCRKTKTHIFNTGQLNTSKRLTDQQDRKSKLKTNSSFQRLLFWNMENQSKQNDPFDISLKQIENHDIELKQYISGEKAFKQQSFSINNFIKAQEIYMPTHKKHKSKSYLGQNGNVKSNSKHYSNRNLTTVVSGQLAKKENLKTEFQPPFQKDKLYSRNASPIRQIKYLDLKVLNSKSTEEKSIQLQLIMKKMTDKHQSNINGLMKKLNLPKLTLGMGKNLQKNQYNNSRINKKVILSQNAKQNIQVKNSKNQVLNLTDSISKFQKNKIKDLRKLQKQIISNKIQTNVSKNPSRNSSKNISRHNSIKQLFLNL